MSFVVPAVLPKSKEDLLEKLGLLTPLPVDRIQIDVVDGKFVPDAPASWPFSAPSELKALQEESQFLPDIEKIEYEIDLMCFDAVEAAHPWVDMGASRLVFHAESVPDLKKLLADAKAHYGADTDFSIHRHISFGLALNLETDSSLIAPYVHDVSFVQLMGISHIGKQGEPFDTRVLEKIKALRADFPKLELQVDGGVTLLVAEALSKLGVRRVIAGSAILRAQNPAAAVAAFEALKSPLPCKLYFPHGAHGP